MKFFMRLIIFWMEYDIALEKQRLEHIRQSIAHDEAVLQRWQIRLMEIDAA